jgi:predicted amidohydrolase YtcJ
MRGGFQNYPEDYEIIAELHAKEQMTVRIAYNLFTQRPKQELEDFERWTDMPSRVRGRISTVPTAPVRCWSLGGGF